MGIFTSIYCIGCVWTVLALLGTFGITSFIMNSWVPYKGPLPSDGPVEGFASKQARIDYFDTGPQRVRAASKWWLIGAATWLVGMITALVLQGRL
jgi:hypothetical protein